MLWILLAAYQGGRFIRAQLASVRAQTCADWRLLVRDDGSTDDTRAVVAHVAREEARIELVEDGARRLGCAGNYGRLAELALARGAAHVMLADQDDVWLPRKVEDTLALMREAERRHGTHVPLLVHTDLEVVDERLQPLAPSFMRYQGIRHESLRPLKTLLVQNFVTGSTTLMNRALLERALPLPPVVAMHDWWFAQCAAALGAVEFLPQATSRYRQHGANVVAAKGRRRTLNPFLTSWPALWRLGRTTYPRAIRQARELRARMPEPSARRDLVDEFLALFDVGPLRRALRAARSGFRSQNLARTLLLYLRMLLVAPEPGEAGRPG